MVYYPQMYGEYSTEHNSKCRAQPGLRSRSELCESNIRIKVRNPPKKMHYAALYCNFATTEITKHFLLYAGTEHFVYAEVQQSPN